MCSSDLKMNDQSSWETFSKILGEQFTQDKAAYLVRTIRGFVNQSAHAASSELSPLLTNLTTDSTNAQSIKDLAANHGEVRSTDKPHNPPPQNTHAARGVMRGGRFSAVVNHAHKVEYLLTLGFGSTFGYSKRMSPEAMVSGPYSWMNNPVVRAMISMNYVGLDGLSATSRLTASVLTRTFLFFKEGTVYTASPPSPLALNDCVDAQALGVLTPRVQFSATYKFDVSDHGARRVVCGPHVSFNVFRTMWDYVGGRIAGKTATGTVDRIADTEEADVGAPPVEGSNFATEVTVEPGGNTVLTLIDARTAPLQGVEGFMNSDDLERWGTHLDASNLREREAHGVGAHYVAAHVKPVYTYRAANATNVSFEEHGVMNIMVSCPQLTAMSSGSVAVAEVAHGVFYVFAVCNSPGVWTFAS